MSMDELDAHQLVVSEDASALQIATKHQAVAQDWMQLGYTVPICPEHGRRSPDPITAPLRISGRQSDEPDERASIIISTNVKGVPVYMHVYCSFTFR